MLSILWQEISKLKQDRIFTSNLCHLIILTLIFCCSLADLQSNSLRIGKQKQIAKFSYKASAGMVIKTCHTFYR